MISHFADDMANRVQQLNSRLVVGLDPHWHRIPESFRAARDHDPFQVISDYFRLVIDSTSAYAVAFKPQIAFFEMFGPDGLRALQELISHLKARDQRIIMDGKRNDIGSTAKAYAHAFFDSPDADAPYSSDAVTLNAYLGSDSIQPFLESPRHGIFALVKTSNPSSGDFQDLRLESGITLADKVAQMVQRWTEVSVGSSGYGNVGAVVGATYPDHMKRLRTLMPQCWILVPGYGAQGGSDEAIKAAFQAGTGALINSSRAICFPSPSDDGLEAAISKAAKSSRDHINEIAFS